MRKEFVLCLITLINKYLARFKILGGSRIESPKGTSLDILPPTAVPLANSSQKDRIAIRQRNKRPMTTGQKLSLSDVSNASY